MVRVNLINPKKLADQHLIAEYSEMLVLASYIKKYPKIEKLPKKYCLGKGHMIFFKDKLIYLKNRHELIKKEMKKRGFKAIKKINLNHFKKDNKGNWHPKKADFKIIKKRLIQKLKLKPGYYRYCGSHKTAIFFIRLLKD